MSSGLPITFGQLSLLRSLESLGQDDQHMANQTHICRLPPGTDIGMVNEAWSQVVATNESLRTRFDTTGAEPTQTVWPFRARALPAVEIRDASFASASELSGELAAKPFSIDMEEPWRAAVAVHDGQPRFLALALHHVAADHAACALLDQQVHQTLGGVTLGPQPRPVDLAREQRSHRAQHSQTIAYWADAWDSFVDSDRVGVDSSERIRPVLQTQVGMAAASEITRRLRISVQAVILGVAYLVLFRLTERDRATFGLIASNRFDIRWASIVSTMNQLTPLTVSADGEARADDFLRDVYAASLEAYLHGSYHVDELRNHLAERRRPKPDPIQFDCLFNFLGEAEEEAADDAPSVTSVEWRQTGGPIGPRFGLNVATGKRLHLALRASRSYLDPDLSAVYLASVESALVGIADGLTNSVDSIDLTPLRPVSRWPGGMHP